MENRKELIKKTILQIFSKIDKDGNFNAMCPFCGKKLVEKKINTSFVIECGTKDCFYENFRGF